MEVKRYLVCWLRRLATASRRLSRDSETSIYWLDIFNEIKNRGVEYILIISTDNLAGISKAINGSFPNTQIQKCVVHPLLAVTSKAK